MHLSSNKGKTLSLRQRRLLGRNKMKLAQKPKVSGLKHKIDSNKTVYSNEMADKNMLCNRLLCRPNAIKKFKKEVTLKANKYLDHRALTTLLKGKGESWKLQSFNIRTMNKKRWNQKDQTFEWETNSITTNFSASTKASVCLNKEPSISPNHNFNKKWLKAPKVKQLNKKGKLSLLLFKRLICFIDLHLIDSNFLSKKSFNLEESEL